MLEKLSLERYLLIVIRLAASHETERSRWLSRTPGTWDFARTLSFGRVFSWSFDLWRLEKPRRQTGKRRVSFAAVEVARERKKIIKAESKRTSGTRRRYGRANSTRRTRKGNDAWMQERRKGGKGEYGNGWGTKRSKANTEPCRRRWKNIATNERMREIVRTEFFLENGSTKLPKGERNRRKVLAREERETRSGRASQPETRRTLSSIRNVIIIRGKKFRMRPGTLFVVSTFYTLGNALLDLRRRIKIDILLGPSLLLLL